MSTGEHGRVRQRGSDPAAGQLPRIHYSQLIYKQGKKPGCRTDFGLWPPATAPHRSHDFSIRVFFGRLGAKAKRLKLPHGLMELRQGSLISLPQPCVLWPALKSSGCGSTLRESCTVSDLTRCSPLINVHIK